MKLLSHLVTRPALFVGTGATYMPDRYRISHGYHEAASMILDRMNEDGRNDALVNPAVYLYRHYIELTLKEFLYMTNVCNDDSILIPQTHDLAALWDIFYSRVIDRLSNESQDEIERLETIGKLVLEMDGFDKRGIKLRYIDHNFRQSINFSPSHLQMTMKAVEAWFSSLYDWWSNGEGP